MFKKIFTLIGSKTIYMFIKIRNYKSIKNNDNNETFLERQTFNEILKNNIEEKKYNLNIILPLLLITIPIFLFSKSIKIILIIISLIIFGILFKLYLPKLKEDKRKKDIIKKFHYALRLMSIQLKAGIGLYDAMKTVSNSNYGSLSEEFKITLNEIQYGANYIDAFKKLSERTNIQSIDKLVSQIIRTLNNGGNLADTLNTLANENSYNMKIKYKEYSEKLNAIMLLYMFIAVLLPVIMFIMIIAATTVMGSIIQPELLLILYLFFFPMIITFMIIIIKRMEPNIS